MQGIIPNDEMPTLKDWLLWCERLFIEDALRISNGRCDHAAKILGIDPGNMTRKLKQLDINYKEFKP